MSDDLKEKKTPGGSCCSRKIKELLFGTQSIFPILPGLILAGIITVLSYLLSEGIGMLLDGKSNPASPILLAVLIGLALKNLFPLSGTFSEGIKFGVKKLLRLGIMLMGIRLSILAVLRIGGTAIGLVAVCIALALLFTIGLSRRIKITSSLGILIAAGTSICGVSAIVAVAPAIEAKEEETAYAIGIITLFGILATLIYPYMVELLLSFDVVQAGFFLGTAIHDTSQVTGASLIYDQLWGNISSTGLTSSQIAVTTKLVRNTFLIGVIPILGYLSARGKGKNNGEKKKIKVFEHIPYFVFGYLLFGILRSLGDLFFGSDSIFWSGMYSSIGKISTYLICAAIACIGLSTDIRKMVKLGWKPLLVGFGAAVSLGLVSGVLVTVFNRFLSF